MSVQLLDLTLDLGDVGQRLDIPIMSRRFASAAFAAFAWIIILSQEDLVGEEGILVLPKNDILKGIFFTLAVVLGIIERLSSS